MSLARVVLVRNTNIAAEKERKKKSARHLTPDAHGQQSMGFFFKMASRHQGIKASRYQGIVASIGLAAGLDPAWIFNLRGITASRRNPFSRAPEGSVRGEGFRSQESGAREDKKRKR